jgi:hypothetical protein
VNDKLSPKEIAELHEVAEWLDSVYTRLDGSIFAFALQMGNEKYHQLLQGDIEEAVKIGIAMNRSMENCGCLFEFLNGTERPPIEFILRARSEINNLAIAVRNLANDEQSIDNDPWVSVKVGDTESRQTTWRHANDKTMQHIRTGRKDGIYEIRKSHLDEYLSPSMLREYLP